MAGVGLGQRAKVAGRRVRGRVVRRWGPVDLFCFEGDNCRWRVPRGGSVTVLLNAARGRVRAVGTTARRWRTRRGVRPSTPAGRVRRLYPGATRERGCYGYNGSEVDALVVRARAAHTLFELSATGGRVRRIHVVRGRFRNLPC